MKDEKKLGSENSEDEGQVDEAVAFQQAIDKQIEKGNRDPEASRARVVASSDATFLTDEIIKKQGKKSYTVEFPFDDDIYQI